MVCIIFWFKNIPKLLKHDDVGQQNRVHFSNLELSSQTNLITFKINAHFKETNNTNWQFTRNKLKKQNSNQQNHIKLIIHIIFFNHYRCHKRKSKSKRCSYPNLRECAVHNLFFKIFTKSILIHTTIFVCKNLQILFLEKISYMLLKLEFNFIHSTSKQTNHQNTSHDIESWTAPT